MWNRGQLWSGFCARLSCLAVRLVLALVFMNGAVARGQVITNGSFEFGYSGWMLSETPYEPGNLLDPTGGTWGIGSHGTTLTAADEVLDHHDQVFAAQTSPGLPITWTATDGSSVAFHLQNQSGHQRIWQDIDLPDTATDLTWDMQYTNHWIAFDSAFGENFLAVNLRTPEGSLLVELFKTYDGQTFSIPVTNFIRDISALAGRSVRLEIELKNLSYFDLALDNFAVLPPSDGGGGPPPTGSEGVDIQVRDRINLKSNGVVAVGILGTAAFDPVNALDRTSIGSGNAVPVHGGHAADLNGDGYQDLLVHLMVQDLDLTDGIGVQAARGTDTQLCLSGRTMDSTPVEGCATVELTGGGR